MFIATIMALTLWAGFPLTASAATVNYIDLGGIPKDATDPIEITSSSTALGTATNTTWYVVNSNVTVESRITVTNDVCLILVDGYTLTASKGINVTGTNKFTIYGQSGGTGKLIATGADRQAGIGGNDGQSGGTIIINGGMVEARNSQYAAGIGGGYKGTGGNVTINGGTVTVYGGYGAAAIGGGDNGAGGTTIINGGIVDAQGGYYGAGIGGGSRGAGGTTTINGGTVTAQGAPYGSGIGGGSDNSANGTFTLSGNGIVFATGGDNGGVAVSDTNINRRTGGILFMGDSGTFYGNAVTIKEDAVIPSGKSITIPAGKTLTIPSDKTLEIASGATINVQGTLINQGTINGPGSIANSGTINNTGTINPNCDVSGTPVINKPAITTTSLPAGTYNTAYSQSLAATGGGTITWTKVSGDLPTSLGLNSSGLISGTPSAQGTFNFKVRATNSVGQEEKDLSITIEKASQTALQITGLNSSYTYGDNQITLSTSGGSGGGSVTYNVTEGGDVASVSGNKVTILKAGTFKITAAKAGDNNYNEVSVTSDDITVNKKSVTITGVTTESKVYDGNTTAIIDVKSATINGNQDNNNLTIVTTGATADFDDKNVGPSKTVTFKGFTLGGSAVNNYTLSGQPAATLAGITAKSVTITAAAKNKVYDGGRAAEIDGTPTINGNLDGENLKVVQGEATFDNKNVGTGKDVTFTKFDLGGSAVGNYSLSGQPKSVKANIAAKTIGINVAVKDKKYDGLNTAEFTETPTLDGNVATDDVTLTDGTPTFSKANIENNIPISFTKFSITGEDAKNYSLTQPSGITANITDGFTPVESTHYNLSAPDDANDWYSGSSFVITAENGYKISKENKDNSDWQDSLTYSADTAHTDVDFYVRDVGTKEISVKKTVSYKKDSDVPSGTVTVNTNAFAAFLQTTTFGLFYKDKVEVTVSASDTLSGVAKIYYLKTDTVYETGAAITESSWQDGGEITDSKIEFSVDPDEWDAEQFNEKFFVYAKLVDNAGNASYLRSDGTVIYTDSEQNTKSISFTKTSTNGVEASVHLNGNTIKEIKNTTNSAILTPTDHYTVDDSTITFNAAYLDSLAAGDYELEISYNPAGETFGSGTAPGTTSIDVTVNKAAQNDLSITDLEESYTYGDGPVEIGMNGGSGSGSVTYSVTKGGDVASVGITDGKITIHKIGTFKITVTKATDDDYEQASVESGEITVKAKELTVEDIAFNSKIYDGTTDPLTMSGTPRLAGVVPSDNVSLDDSKVTYAFVDPNVATSVTINRNGEYALTGDNDDISNYTLTQPEGPFSAGITQRPLIFEGTVTATKRYDGNANFTAEEIEIEEPSNFDNVVPAETVTLDETNAAGSLKSENVGSGVLELTADFTLSGGTATNYALTEQPEVTASITQAEPQTITWPTAKPITYGIKLQAVELDGGEGDGEFAWTDGTIIPTVAGKGYEVTFTPRDAENYDYENIELTCIIEIKVNPATGSFGNPDAINATYTSDLTLAGLKLPSGYVWDAPETALAAGDGQSFPATFTHSSGNYTSASGAITVNVAKDDAQDTDGDGVPDYIEEQQGTDPTDPNDVKDTDGDGVPDYIEEQDGTDPNDPADAKDTDGDGVPDYVEEQQGTNPTDKNDAQDTDGDGVPDYIEEQQGTDPNDPVDVKDTDGDGVPDYIEEQQGTDPTDKTNMKDTDGDGVPDYIEEQQGTNPTDKNDFKDADGNGVPDYIHPPSGWVYENGVWKYFVGGEAQTGWLYDTNYKAWYYLGTNGTMQTGWVYDQNDKAWYYLAGNGKMVAGKWLHDTDGRWYYLSGNGKMLTGKRNIGGKTYSFRGNGVWIG
jgi:hypothetical protein